MLEIKKIRAATANFTDDGYSTFFGFADDATNPVNFVFLKMTNHPDEQDSGLGQSGVHIEIGELPVNGYDHVEDIIEMEAGLTVRLTSASAQQAGIKQDIEIEWHGGFIDETPLNELIEKFRNRLRSTRLIQTASAG